MGIFFNNGEKKVRPGVYQNYTNVGSNSVVGVEDGVVAVAIKSNWGPLGKVVTIENAAQAQKIYGLGGNSDTVSVIDEILNGGALKVKAIRLGTATSAGTAALKDNASSAATVINLALKYSGSRTFTYTVRTNPAVSTEKQLIIYDENAVVRDTFTFTSGTGEVDALMAAYQKQGSEYVTLTKQAAGSGVLALVSQGTITAGTDPSITNANYTDALNLLEAQDWNVLCVDTSNSDVLSIVQGYIDRVYLTGKMVMAVIAEPTSVTFETRLSHAKAYNDYKIVYFGGAWKDNSDVTYDGYKAAARIAGMISNTPSNASITHKTISGASNLVEFLTTSQYESAIKNGMLMVSANSSGAIWIDSGINTMTTATGEDDEGWKKIKRVKVRFELMQRVSDTTESLIGNINNNADGRAEVIQNVQAVLNTMVAENKIADGATVAIDSDNSPSGDSAWFTISADDIDSLEEIYFGFQFRFTEDN